MRMLLSQIRLALKQVMWNLELWKNMLLTLGPGLMLLLGAIPEVKYTQKEQVPLLFPIYGTDLTGFISRCKKSVKSVLGMVHKRILPPTPTTFGERLMKRLICRIGVEAESGTTSASGTE